MSHPCPSALFGSSPSSAAAVTARRKLSWLHRISPGVFWHARTTRLMNRLIWSPLGRKSSSLPRTCASSRSAPIPSRLPMPGLATAGTAGVLVSSVLVCVCCCATSCSPSVLFRAYELLVTGDELGLLALPDERRAEDLVQLRRRRLLPELHLLGHERLQLRDARL